MFKKTLILTFLMLIASSASVGQALTLEQKIPAVSGNLIRPEGALALLFGEGERKIVDPLKFEYRVFSVSPESPLQGLIDGITARLLQTEIGQQICGVIFHRQAELLVSHLGMSPSAAKAAVDLCPSDTSGLGPVIGDGDGDLNKSLSLSRGPRKYKIVVTDRPDLPFDSWTDSFTNDTTIFVHHSSMRSDINLRHLTQVIAHEMAIYFDGKSWPLGPGWSRLLEIQGVKLKGENLKASMVAALNPTVGTVLASIRAFKIERQMVRELYGQGLLGREKVLYPANEFPFLRLNCNRTCLSNYILSQQKWIEPIYIQLLALAPHFRVRRLQLLSEKKGVNYEGFDETLNLMERKPIAALTALTAVDSWMSLEFISGYSDIGFGKDKENSLRLIRDFLKEDLELLASTQVQWAKSQKPPMDLLTFLTLPVLSDINISLAAGPRPRIRSGGTR